jgi:hypothetical protein
MELEAPTTCEAAIRINVLFHIDLCAGADSIM